MSKTLEELGYKKVDGYKNIDDCTYTKSDNWETHEIFFSNNEVICQSKNKYALDFDPWESKFITMEELKAINKKCEELGWLGE